MFGKGQGAMKPGRQHRHRQHGERSPHGPEAVSTLDGVSPGRICRVKRLAGQGPVRQRLLDLGIVPGSRVTVIRSAPLRDPIEIRVGDSFVTVRRAEAAGIEVADD